MSTVRPSSTTPAAGKAAQRRAAAQERDAAQRRAARRRPALRWGGLLAAVLVLAIGVIYLISRPDDEAATTADGNPTVGGDLHTVTVIGGGVYVGGHEAVAVSHDGGKRWQRIASLDGADAMGWAVTPDAVLVGGHPGLYRSTDQAATFTKVTGAAAIEDVHALGGAGGTIYLASPKSGLLTSTDGGQSWQVRNAQAGRSFMGTLLVDPTDPNRLIAPDMATGLASSTDGGRTWKSLGGPTKAMAVTWNPTDAKQLIAVGMSGAARSRDGGGTWQPIQVPAGVSAISYDTTGATVYAAALAGNRAHLYRSTDGDSSWAPTG